MKTTVRTFRAPDEVWVPAQLAAEEYGDNLSEVLRKALVRYAKSHPTKKEEKP